MNKQYKLLRDNVLIKREINDKSDGGILLPASKNKTSQVGEVMSVGQGRQLKNGATVSMGVKVGDKVIFGKFAGSEIKVDKEEFVIVAENEIMGVIECQ